MGGGKGSVDKYVTPVRSGRIIVELAGKCEFAEVKDFLQRYANQLPFKARAVSHEMLVEEKEQEKELEKLNTNPYTLKYVMQNNLGGCHRWMSPYDHKWFGKHL